LYEVFEYVFDHKIIEIKFCLINAKNNYPNVYENV